MKNIYTDITVFESELDRIFAEMKALLLSKRADYGPGNIPKFGERGVAMRLYDKVERLVNLTWTDAKPQNETLLDTWMDVIGYGVLGTMERRRNGE